MRGTKNQINDFELTRNTYLLRLWFEIEAERDLVRFLTGLGERDFEWAGECDLEQMKSVRYE